MSSGCYTFLVRGVGRSAITVGSMAMRQKNVRLSERGWELLGTLGQRYGSEGRAVEVALEMLQREQPEKVIREAVESPFREYVVERVEE